MSKLRVHALLQALPTTLSLLGSSILVSCAQVERNASTEAALVACPDTFAARILGPVPEPDTRTLAAAAADSSYRLTLNIPAFRLDLWHADTVVQSIRVAVGRPRYPTPLGTYTLTAVTWNPWWVPPPSEWARREKRTPPGPINPMGKVKLGYSEYYYLHGTPDSVSVGSAASHGCVRMHNEDAVQLAVLLQQRGLLGLQDAEQAMLLQSWDSTRTLPLLLPLPLDVRYDLVEVHDAMVIVHEDVYRRAPANRFDDVMTALVAAGIDAAAIDSGATERFARSARHGGETLIDRLLRSTSER